MSAGSVEIVTSPHQDQDVATVEVVASYFWESVRDQAKVCRILRKDGEIGVGIFVSRMKLLVMVKYAECRACIDSRMAILAWPEKLVAFCNQSDFA